MRPQEWGRGSLESPSQVVENTSARFGGFHVFLLAAAAHGDRHECLRHIGSSLPRLAVGRAGTVLAEMVLMQQGFGNRFRR